MILSEVCVKCANPVFINSSSCQKLHVHVFCARAWFQNVFIPVVLQYDVDYLLFYFKTIWQKKLGEAL